MKQDYARTIGYLALLILFVQIVPFGPFFRVVATGVCTFILMGIAFSISNFSQKNSTVENEPLKKSTKKQPKQEEVVGEDVKDASLSDEKGVAVDALENEAEDVVISAE